MIKKIKWLVAKEGLIIIAIAGILYLVKAYAPPLAVPYPQVRLAFQDGTSHIVEIYPEMNASELAGKVSPGELVKKYHCPRPELISKRIDKFVQDSKKQAALKDYQCVNEKQLYLYRAYFDLLYGPLFYRTLTVYLLLLLLRFVFWAAGILKKNV